jgi:hypothetical protein
LRQLKNEVVIDETIPPVAKGVICVDYDATIVPWGELGADVSPLPDAVETIRAFKDAGYKIVILTSRMSPTWWIAEGWGMLESVASKWWDSVADVLNKHGIPFDGITCEKVPAQYYIDDRAIEFKNNWSEIRKRVLG